MKPFNGYEAKESKPTYQLPAGGYVCKIIDAEVESCATKDGGTLEKLKLSIDVEEGDYFEFFRDQFANSTFDDKKWKGVYRIAIPDEGSQYAASQKKTFGNLLWAIEESNPGYRWDWNEKGLAGKLLGVIFRNREWDYQGKTGWMTEAGAATTVENVRAGKYRPLKDKPLKASQAPSKQSEVMVPVDEDDIPF